MSGVYQEAFNNKLLEFLNDLIATFPEIQNDLKSLKHAVGVVRNIEPTLPQQFFDEHVAGPYEGHIVTKDEQFFLEHDYTSDLQSIPTAHGFDLDIIKRIKGIWKHLNDTNRDAIWKYLHVLCALNKKCKFET